MFASTLTEKVTLHSHFPPWINWHYDRGWFLKRGVSAGGTFSRYRQVHASSTRVPWLRFLPIWLVMRFAVILFALTQIDVRLSPSSVGVTEEEVALRKEPKTYLHSSIWKHLKITDLLLWLCCIFLMAVDALSPTSLFSSVPQNRFVLFFYHFLSKCSSSELTGNNEEMKGERMNQVHNVVSASTSGFALKGL